MSSTMKYMKATEATCRQAGDFRADGTEAAQLPFPVVSFHINLPAVDHAEVASDENGLARLFLIDYSKALSNAIDTKDNNFHAK